MRKTKVYWAYYTAPPMVQTSLGKYSMLDEKIHHTQLMGIPPERLINNLKSLPTWRDTLHGDILKCPAAVDHIRNTYVIKSPCDELFVREGDRIRNENVEYDANTYLQFQNTISYCFFSESPVMMTVTPPYYHKGVLPGSSACLDISKWFRPVSANILAEDYKTIPIKEGQPIMYVFFDKAVELKQFSINQELVSMSNVTVNLKHYLPNKSLKELYNMFTRNRMNKRVLKEIKRNLI